jgi:hypothetical protein
MMEEELNEILYEDTKWNDDEEKEKDANTELDGVAYTEEDMDEEGAEDTQLYWADGSMVRIKDKKNIIYGSKYNKTDKVTMGNF